MVELALVAQLQDIVPCYPQIAPADAQCPFLVYSRTSTKRGYSHDGNDGMPKASVELTIYGGLAFPGYKIAKEKAEEVRLAIDGRSDFCERCLIDNEADVLVDQTHGVTLSISVLFRESTA